MSKSKWIWMPHAGHFICGSRCRFRLNTYVNGYIVSTVGEMPDVLKNDGSFDTIGINRLYKTMVFKARKSKHKCCPYEQGSGLEIDFEGYNDAGSAMAGHMKMCLKYDRRKV